MIKDSDIFVAKSIIENLDYPLSSTEIEKSLNTWERNKVIYTLYKKRPEIFDLIGEGSRIEIIKKCKELEMRQVNVEKTALSVYELISNVNPILIKTIKEFPYSASDVDFLFRTKDDVEDAVHILKKSGYTVKETREKNKLSASNSAFKFEKTNKKGINIDLYSSIGWSGIEYFNNEDIFQKKRRCKIGECEIPIPSIEFEFLITSAHLGTQVDREVLLMDVLHLILLSRQGLDISFIVDKANESGLSAIAYYIIYLVDKFSKDVFSKLVSSKEFFEKLSLPRYLKKRIEKELEFLAFPMQISVLTHRGLRKVKAWNELHNAGLAKMLANEYEYSLQTLSHIIKKNVMKHITKKHN